MQILNLQSLFTISNLDVSLIISYFLTNGYTSFGLVGVEKQMFETIVGGCLTEDPDIK